MELYPAGILPCMELCPGWNSALPGTLPGLELCPGWNSALLELCPGLYGGLKPRSYGQLTLEAYMVV